MAGDFFEATQKNVPNLNRTERQLFEYVIKNMDNVKNMSIQKFAEECFISTTTVFRFTQKLGFSGYAEFINSLLVTAHQNKSIKAPEGLYGKSYSEEYLKNIIETVRVISGKNMAAVSEALDNVENIYIIADENSAAAGLYTERLFVGLGFQAYYLTALYDLQTLPGRVTGRDLIIALSYSGKDTNVLETVERVLSNEKPFLMSITRAENNPLESISNVNFYIFADEIHSNGIDLTTSVPSIIVMELLAYMKVKNLSSID